MSKLIIINAKGSPELKEAIRVVAFKNKKRSSSALIIEILESNPDIKAELKKNVVEKQSVSKDTKK